MVHAILGIRAPAPEPPAGSATVGWKPQSVRGGSTSGQKSRSPTSPPRHGMRPDPCQVSSASNGVDRQSDALEADQLRKCSVARTRQCQKARVSGRHPASARDRLEGRRAGWPYRRQPANAREARHDPGSTEAAGAAGRHRHAHALLRHRRALSGRSHRGVPAAAGAGRQIPGGATAPGPRARRGRSTVGLRHRQPLHHGCGGGARRCGAGGGRGRPRRERCRAGALHGGGRARHPLPPAQGRRAALGNPGGDGGTWTRCR